MCASNNLSREAICELNLQAMATTKVFFFFFKFDSDGGLNAGQSPPHPPTKKASVLDRSLEG